MTYPNLVKTKTDPGARRDENDPRAPEIFRPYDGGRIKGAALLGVPFDGAVSGRKGAADGPAGIRGALGFFSAYHWDSDSSLEDAGWFDVGDVDVDQADTEATHSRVRATVAALAADASPVFVLGGDNSITYATVAGLLDAVEGTVGIVDLDAHLDVRSTKNGISSGSPYRRLVKDFPRRVRGANIAQIGLRNFANAKTYRDWAVAHSIRTFDMDAVVADGFDAVLSDSIEAAGDGTDHLVFSIDMDAVDQAEAPGVSAPSPGGLTGRNLLSAARALSRERRTRLGEIVEVAPRLDAVGNTQRLAAAALLEFVAGCSKPS